MKELIHTGLPQQLAQAFLDDLVQPKKRGSVSYLEVDSENIDKRTMDEAVAGLFFFVGKSGWILAFPKMKKIKLEEYFQAPAKFLKKMSWNF